MEKREHRISLAKGEPKQNVGPVGVCKGFSMVRVTWSATPELLKWGSPPPAMGTFGTVQRYLWLSQMGGVLASNGCGPEILLSTLQ